MKKSSYFDNTEDAIDAVLAAVGNRIVLGIPLGIGKPNHFVNALYRRVKECPAFHLKILTALSLEKPRGKSELEKRFLDPFVKRVFGDYEDLEYVRARNTNSLPPNIEIVEFFMKTGECLTNDLAQQEYIYSNYTHAARDMLMQGVNLMAQAVAVDDSGAELRLSLSSNPEITLDILDMIAADPTQSVLTVACYNRKMPFMENDAAVDPNLFDVVIADPDSTHDLFAPPNMKISPQDYAIGLVAGTLVKDGGTLQIGIGSLGDAICHTLILRDQQNSEYRQMVSDLFGGTPPAITQLAPFSEGLYGCSEMFVNGFLKLIEQGIVRRAVFDHPDLQRLLNERKITPEVTPQMLRALRDERLIAPILLQADVDFLKHYGIFKPGVELQDGNLTVDNQSVAATITDEAALDAVAKLCLGQQLTRGIIMHGGFFLGPRAFYQSLRDLTPELRSKIGMSRISSINDVFGRENIVRPQRRDARFINCTMLATLLGAAASDSLDSGRVVSGVGGQYNFVAMAHLLPDARSLLLLRATRHSHGKLKSNIVWNYGQTTIPRHLRDIIVTEYGFADLRGMTDCECVKRMLAIADSRFQEGLLEQAKNNGKISKDYEIPASQRNNTPEAIEAKLRTWRQRGLLPDFPFGTDFTEEELIIGKALKKLKSTAEHPLDLIRQLFKPLVGEKKDFEAYLKRMRMEEVECLKMRVLRRLFVGNLS
ncbi:MAG: acetyl-CoA hydrolase/transferase C-terminal domain-containing protein [Burkholderiales bacterium]